MRFRDEQFWQIWQIQNVIFKTVVIWDFTCKGHLQWQPFPRMHVPQYFTYKSSVQDLSDMLDLAQLLITKNLNGKNFKLRYSQVSIDNKCDDTNTNAKSELYPWYLWNSFLWIVIGSIHTEALWLIYIHRGRFHFRSRSQFCTLQLALESESDSMQCPAYYNVAIWFSVRIRIWIRQCK